MAVSETVFSTIDDFPKTGSGFGVVRNPLTLYEGFTIPEYSRCIFINYTNSNDGALIAIISDKTYTAFRNNGKWQSGRILVTNTDLTPSIYTGDILAHANRLSAGFYPISTSSGTINGIAGYSGIGYIAKANDTTIVIFLTVPYNQKTFTNVYNGEWKGWKELTIV